MTVKYEQLVHVDMHTYGHVTYLAIHSLLTDQHNLLNWPSNVSLTHPLSFQGLIGYDIQPNDYASKFRT